MKTKILFLLAFLISFLFIGCIQKPNNKNTEKIRSHLRTDSLNQASYDSTMSCTALGNTQFGITEKEALKTATFKGGTIYSKNEISSNFESLNINGRNFSEIHAYFDKDTGKLNLISIKGHWYTADYYNTDVIPSVNILLAKFTKENGDPKTSNQIPSISDLEHGTNMEIYAWVIGIKNQKHISIRIEEEYSSYNYRVNCDIYKDEHINETPSIKDTINYYYRK